MAGLGKGGRGDVKGMAGGWNRFKGRSDDNGKNACSQVVVEAEVFIFETYGYR